MEGWLGPVPSDLTGKCLTGVDQSLWDTFVKDTHIVKNARRG